MLHVHPAHEGEVAGLGRGELDGDGLAEREVGDGHAERGDLDLGRALRLDGAREDEPGRDARFEADGVRSVALHPGLDLYGLHTIDKGGLGGGGGGWGGVRRFGLGRARLVAASSEAESEENE